MADADNDMGVLSQEDLDALIAGAALEGAEEDMSFGAPREETKEETSFGLAEEEMNFGAFGEQPDPEPALSMSGGLVDLPSFDLPAGREGALDLPAADGMGRVRDIPLEVTVELGRTRLLIRDILDLSPGSIIELDKIAGEPVDLFANGLLIARGEVIVIDDNFGVRVTEIITAAERKGGERDAHALAA